MGWEDDGRQRLEGVKGSILKQTLNTQKHICGKRIVPTIANN
jgi:hypothetical protein